MHVFQGESGASPSANGVGAVFEFSGNNGISFLSPSANNLNIIFGDENDNEEGFIQYQHNGASDDKMNFNVEDTTIMSLTNGNVGIGTTGPGYKLDVNGVVQAETMMVTDHFAATGGAYPRIQSDVANTPLFAGASNSSSGNVFVVAKNDMSNVANYLMTVSNSGNVGIGTTESVAKLHIVDANQSEGWSSVVGTAGVFESTSPNITLLGSATSESLRLLFADTANQNEGTIGYSNNSDYMWFETNDEERVRITSSGNVGIGTTGPGGNLHLLGDNVADTPQGDIILSRYWGSSINTRGSAIFHYYNSSLLEDMLVFGVSGDSATSYDAPNQISQAKMVINSYGNVGIGTTAPSAKLHVAGPVHFDVTSRAALTGGETQIWGESGFGGHLESYQLAFDVGISAATRAMTITNTGNVGIGTTAPTQKLDVAGVIATSGANGSLFAYSRDGTGNAFEWYNPTGDDFRLYSSGDLVTIKTTGNVGIGTTNPLAKLHVEGDIELGSIDGNKQIYTWAATDDNWRIGMSASPGFSRSMATAHVQYLTYGSASTQGFAVGVNGGNSGFEIRGSDHAAYFRGNVGIGTTNPGRALDVNSGIIRLNNYNGLTPSITSNGDFAIGNSGTGNDGGRVWVRSGSTTFHFRSYNNAADYSEFFYNGEDETEIGDVITLDENTPSFIDGTGKVKKADTPYQEHLLGVVTETDRGTGGNDPNDDRRDNSDYSNVGLLGHVYTKASTINGSIQEGDPLTASDISGVAMKATKAGYIIGRALEDYTESDHNKVKKIMVYVKVVWYDPDTDYERAQLAILDSGLKDLELKMANNEEVIMSNKLSITDHESRITNNELNITNLNSTINQTALQTITNQTTTANLNKYQSFQRTEMQTIEFYDFSNSTNETSSTLNNFSQESDYYQGDYQPADYQEITVNLDNPLDISDYQTKSGFLNFEIYIENADTIEDLKTEFGNQRDANEIEWTKSDHPFLTDGWNKIRLPLNIGTKTGEIDWEDIKYFRTYFKFNSDNKIQIRNVELEMYEKSTIADLDLDNFNLNQDLDLTDDVDQGKAINIIAGRLDDNKTILTSLSEREGQIDQQLNQLTITIDNLNTLTTILTDQVMDHEMRIQTLEEQIDVAGVNTEYGLPVILEGWNDVLESEKIEFNEEGDLRVRKIEAERAEFEFIKLEQKDSAPSCDEEYKGMMYFSSNENAFYGCDGKNWGKLEFTPEGG